MSKEKVQTSECGLARILYFLLYFPHAEKLDSKCKVWVMQEDTFLKKIVTEVGVNDWTAVATRLKQRYDQFNRTGKQCR